VLGILAQNIKAHPFEDAFLHSLITGLMALKEEFEQEDFCTAVFDEFFFTCITGDNVARHLLRLLWWVHPRLPAARIDTLLKVAEPTNGVESIMAVFEQLKERISLRQTSLSPGQTEKEIETGNMTPFSHRV